MQQFNYVAFAAFCVVAVTSLVSGEEPKPTIITTIELDPYLSRKGTADPPKNEDFEGYIPDLVASLAKRANFKYELKVVADGKYGMSSNGQWDGMVGELVNKNADVAAAPLTMSDRRSEVIDFTDAFMTFDKAIVMKKPAAAAPADASGSAASTTTSASSTTQLPEIKSVKDLGQQDAIVYGVINDGTTAEYFRSSKDPVYQAMFSKMTTDKNVANVEEGIERVRNGYNGRPYAFIIEENMAEYAVSRKPCDLVSIKGQLETREYALATTKGSALKEKLNAALAAMKDEGELQKLRDKWWSEKSECNGAAGSSVASVSALVFLLLPVSLLSVFVVA